MFGYLICLIVAVGLAIGLLRARDVVRDRAVIESGKKRLLPIASKELVEVPSRLRFVIDGLFLERSFEHVCPSTERVFVERFHFASGVALDEKRFLICHLLPVRYARQSAGGVRVADASTIVCLAKLDRVGSPLLAHFHSHPGFGPEANHPSMTDRTFQATLEKGGHIAIGGIFSRDGFVRFFAGTSERFEVEIRGKNITKVGTNVYQLSLGIGPLRVEELECRVQPG